MAWLLVKKKWPEFEVDHVRGKEHGNKWKNLRSASHKQNRQNNKHRKNVSGYPGVTRHHRDARWKAQIHAGGKTKYLGLYETPAKAFAAFDAVARKEWGKFYRWKEGFNAGAH